MGGVTVDHCCGFSLLFGVEVIAAAQIIYSVLVLCFVSSKDELDVIGVTISPSVEVIYASWCLLGIPLAIAAGVGALYQMSFHLYTFALYLVGALVLHVGLIGGAVVSGQLCRELVAPELQRLGQHFVCSFIDTFLGFWGFMFLGVQFYCMLVVQSAAEHIVDRNRYPELLAAAEKLRGVPSPPQPEAPSFKYGPAPTPIFQPPVPGPAVPVPMPAATMLPQQVMQSAPVRMAPADPRSFQAQSQPAMAGQVPVFSQSLPAGSPLDPMSQSFMVPSPQ